MAEVTAKFTQGSTMRHVVVMTATASVGLLSLFLVDAVNLFYISLLGVTELAAAIGFAGTIQFFMISVSIGLMIAGTAMVSRAIGAGDKARARQLATSALITGVLALSFVAGVLWIFRAEAVGLLGATGETQALASHFLSIALPSMPLLAVGMGTSGTLRAIGEARQAMMVTLSGGIFSAILDPILIFGLGLELTGAAIAIAVTRLVIAGIGLYLVIRRHDMLAPPRIAAWLSDLPKLFSIAAPAMATQLSTPFGMAYLTVVVAEHGDDAVAGWAVIGRCAALAFGGLFALAGAIGPIVGQNYGARLYPRIASAYRDALLFILVYVLFMWALLWLASGLIVQGFGLKGAGVTILQDFVVIGAGAYVFTGALFVSNAAFNNLGRPLWSTAFNWSRDAVAIPGMAALFAAGLGVSAAVYIQATASVVVGVVAAWVGWRLVTRIAERAVPAQAAPVPAPLPPFASGRAVGAMPVTAPQKPLESTDQNR